MSQAKKRLIVNADDFGFTSDVNAGIVKGHTAGIVTATTLMANGAAFEDAVRLAREHPQLDVGGHLVLVQGHSLHRRGAELPRTISALVPALVSRSIDPYAEFRAQISRMLDAGVPLTHLDTHKHTHLWPSVLDAVARLSEEFGIRWVRRPFDLPMNAAGVPVTTRLLSGAAAGARRRFQRKLAAHGCRTTDHFAGFQITGRFRTGELLAVLRRLPPGLTEFMTHPGYFTGELSAAATRLKESRARELEALTAPEVRQTLGECEIELTRYSEL